MLPRPPCHRARGDRSLAPKAARSGPITAAGGANNVQVEAGTGGECRPSFGGLVHSFQGSHCAGADRPTPFGACRDDGVQWVDVAVGLDWQFDAVDTEVLGGAGDGQATLGVESSPNCHEGLSVEELCG